MKRHATDPEALPLVDLSRAELWQDPAGALREAREAGPVARTTRGERVILRYAETERLMADSRMRTIGARLLDGIGIVDGPLADWWRLVMFNTNPPEHERLRGLVSRAFTPQRTEALRPQVRDLARRLIAPALDAGKVDFEALVADPLPIRVTCALLGVPESDREGVARQTSAIGAIFTTRLTDEQRRRSELALTDLTAYLGQLLDEREKHPTDDLLSALATGQAVGGERRRDANGDRLSRYEAEAMGVNLLFAGHDTTRGLLSLSLGALLRTPEAVTRLRAEPALIPQAVEEMLRFEPPVLGSLRAPCEPLEIGEHVIPAFTPIHFLFPGGNRDPRAFEAPDVFDVTRRGPRPLAFGLGPHFCLGAGLARMEGQEVLAALLESTSEIELVGGLEAVPFATIRRLAHGMPLRLRAA